jgi:hypothetical protein
MSVNVFASQIAASNAVSFSESAESTPQRLRAPIAAGARKNFATLLHAVHRPQERESSHKAGDRQPLDTSHHEARAEWTKTQQACASKHHESESRPDKTEERGRPDWGNREAADVPETDRESLELRDLAHPNFLDAPRAPIETPIPVPSIGQSDVVEPNNDEGGLLSAEEQDETAALDSMPPGLSLVIAAGLLPSHAASGDLPIPVDGPHAMTDQEELRKNVRAMAAEMVADIHEAVGHEPVGHAPQSVRDGAEQGSDNHHGASPSVPLPTGQSLASKQAGLHLDQKLQRSSVSPIPENAPSPPTSDSVRPAQAIQQDRPVVDIVQANASSPVQKDAPEMKPLSAMAHDRQTVVGDTLQSDMDWSEQGSREQDGDESPSSHQMVASPAPTNSASAMVGEAGTSGAAALSMSRPLESSSAPVAAPPLSAPRDAEELPLPATTRSVVFEVAQPDLGRVNVRVAMANEMVHAYLSSDRAEVGQFLINGQDRLQAALQANGLEMGQFRVDIDRQQAGRSFQQGQSHEQGRDWNHGSPQREGGDRAAEPHDSRRSWSQGRLNLVA